MPLPPIKSPAAPTAEEGVSYPLVEDIASKASTVLKNGKAVCPPQKIKRRAKRTQNSLLFIQTD